MKLEQKRNLTLIIILLIGLILLLFPVYVSLVGSTHNTMRLQRSPLPLSFGSELFNNFRLMFDLSFKYADVSFARMFLNSLILGSAVAVGKIATAMLSAYALVFFRFPLRNFIFWFILLTLMLPVETRIFSTYQIMNDFNLINTYLGLILPLIGSATATFFFRQYFSGMPDELCEAAQIDGMNPLHFFYYILVPLSKTAIACVFVLMFIFGWNQYLWPILVTNSPDFNTLFLGIRQFLNDEGNVTPWNVVLLISVIAVIPPVLVLLVLQKAFIAFMIDHEK